MHFKYRSQIPRLIRKAVNHVPQARRAVQFLENNGLRRPKKLDGGEFLIATKRGLFLLSDSGIHQLLEGKFYGLTRMNDSWFAFESDKETGWVIRFSLKGNRLLNLTRLEGTLSPGCHQMDVIGNELYIADTYNNGILVCTPDEQRLNPKSGSYPSGELADGRQSENYVHLNSLWKGEDRFAVFFHNETRKTGRPSEVVLLSPDCTIAERRATTAENGHNILWYREHPLFCDSGGGALIWGEKTVFKPGWFTRGLSVTQSRILVGGSAYGSREERELLPGAVWILSDKFQLLEHIDIPGMVQEIRCVNQPDYGMSRTFETA